MISDLLNETFFSITSNKARSGLTILGVVIGIASVIAMVSVGSGASEQISSRISSMGSNLLMISPGQQKSIGSTVRQSSGSANTLLVSDMDAISEKV